MAQHTVSDGHRVSHNGVILVAGDRLDELTDDSVNELTRHGAIQTSAEARAAAKPNRDRSTAGKAGQSGLGANYVGGAPADLQAPGSRGASGETDEGKLED